MRSRALAQLSGIVSIVVAMMPVSSPASPEQKASFEAVSVKRSMPNQNGMSIASSGNRFRAINATVKSLILNAFPKTRAFQIIGAPTWIDTEGYDVDAVSETPLTSDSVQQMLQTLLQDRFKLQWHTDTRQMPLYTLIVGKDGPKLQSAKEGERTRVSGTGRGRMTFQRIGLSSFADNLSYQVDRIVVDQTGLTGYFTFTLEWTPDSVRDADSTAPSLVTAIQEQLGLKLESGKGPVEVLVIDSVERPSEN